MPCDLKSTALDSSLGLNSKSLPLWKCHWPSYPTCPLTSIWHCYLPSSLCSQIPKHSPIHPFLSPSTQASILLCLHSFTPPPILESAKPLTKPHERSAPVMSGKNVPYKYIHPLKPMRSSPFCIKYGFQVILSSQFHNPFNPSINRIYRFVQACECQAYWLMWSWDFQIQSFQTLLWLLSSSFVYIWTSKCPSISLNVAINFMNGGHLLNEE